MTSIKKAFTTSELTVNWTWRDKEGILHKPSEIASRHLFHTFRMIWNNFMPAEYNVGKVKLYSFTSYYTDTYIKQAILHLGTELTSRSDLTNEQRIQLQQMADFFGRKQHDRQLVEVKQLRKLSAAFIQLG